MKIKDGCTASTNDFWYGLTDGGYLNPLEILENPDDTQEVINAITVLQEFKKSCLYQIEGFYQ